MSVQHNIRVIYGFVVREHWAAFYVGEDGEAADEEDEDAEEYYNVEEWLTNSSMTTATDDGVMIVGIELGAVRDYTRAIDPFIKMDDVRQPTVKDLYRVAQARDGLKKVVPDRIKDDYIGVYIFGEVS